MVSILFRLGALYQNGTEAFVMNVYRKLNNKINIDFILNNPTITPYYKEVIDGGARIFVCPPRKPNPIKSVISEYMFFKNHAKEYDAIHFCYGSLADITLIFFAYWYKIPIRILHSHNSSCKGIHSRILHNLFKPIANKLTTHHFACSEKAGAFFASKRVHYEIINNGIDINRYSLNIKKRNEIRKILSIPDDCIVIGHVGRFTTVKNHDFILDVFFEYLKLNHNSILMLIGIGELEENIRTKAENLGISSKILFMGLRNDVGDLMQAMDLFLMPSLFEGLPFVLVEAQAAGLPCVISNNIDNGVNITGNVKFMSLDSTAKEWAMSIVSDLTNFDRKNQDTLIRENGYDINTTAEYLLKIYNSNNNVSE